jgi:DNA-binding winged helix-turn-helix (wHTH) protein/TolB-like protein
MDSHVNTKVTFGNVAFDPIDGTLRVDGQVRRLRPQSAAVLSRLLEQPGQLVTHDRLIQAVWGDTIVTDNSLAQCISEIRAALGPAYDHCIETVPRRGYVFQAPMAAALDLPPVAPATPVNPMAAHTLRLPTLMGGRMAGNIRSTPWTGLVVGAFALLLCAAFWFGLRLISLTEPSRLSLAVLPLQSRGVALDQTWFAENLGEDLTTNLSRIPGAHVIAHVSTQPYAAGNTDVRQVGHDLKVRYIVSGNVDRVGERVTMNLYMAETATGEVRWTERFQATLSQLHGVQRQIADRVANTLHVRLVDAEVQRIERNPARNPVANDLALEAWAAWNRGSPADVARAKELAQRALVLDDHSVLAWKTMASWHLRARINQSIPIEEAVAGAEAAAQRAMAIDPDHPLVHTVYGASQVLRGHYEVAQQALLHEIATNPSHPVAYSYLGLAHLMQGQSREAVALYQQAISISPRDPRMSRFQRYLALAYLHGGDLVSSLHHAKLATQVPQVDRTAWAMLAAVCALSADQRCVDDASARLRQLWPSFSIAQAESEWPPTTLDFTTQHKDYLRGLRLAGF